MPDRVMGALLYPLCRRKCLSRLRIAVRGLGNNLASYDEILAGIIVVIEPDFYGYILSDCVYGIEFGAMTEKLITSSPILPFI